ncbi:MAG: CehA/McbA family metallohydrolase [Chloroflexota bacterium]
MATELLSIRAEVTHKDTYSERIHEFEVPENVGTLSVTFEIEPKRVGPYGQAIGVFLHDPTGFRGSPGRTVPPARLGAWGATPGMVPGPLPLGTWKAEVNLNYVLEGPPCTYDLRVWLEDSAPSDALPLSRMLPTAIPNTGPGWYGGDLHMHTHHSDGQWSVAELWQAIQQRSLDFFVLTDHNTLTGLAEVATLDTGRVLPIPGMEVTMRKGHMLAIGADTLIDWWVGRDGRTIADVVDDIHAAGAAAIVAHPGADGSPICHGCRWEMANVDPRRIDAVEVWNSPWQLDEDNDNSMIFYDAWLARGYRVPLSGGSDEHGGRPTFAHGVPTTYVYARELSREAIVEGIRAGRMVVSSGPTLRLTAQAGGAAAMPGDTLPAAGPFRLEASVADLDVPARLILLGNGEVLAAQPLEAGGTCLYTSNQPDPGWYRAELRNLDGTAMLAIASPIFLA